MADILIPGKLYRFQSHFTGTVFLYKEKKTSEPSEIRILNDSIVLFLEQDVSNNMWTKVVFMDMVGWAVIAQRELTEITSNE